MEATRPAHDPGHLALRRACLAAPLLAVLGILFGWYALHAPASSAIQVIATCIILAAGIFAFFRPTCAAVGTVGAIALINAMPLHAAVGHFPPSILLFCGVAAGWAGGRLWRDDLPPVPGAFATAAATLACAGVISGVLTMLRYAEFAPLTGADFRSMTINLLGETSSVAVRNAFAAMAVFVCGPIMGWIGLWILRQPGGWRRCSLSIMIGLTVSAIYGIVQSRVGAGAGNTAHFARLGQINGTFIDPNALGSWYALAIPLGAWLLWSSRRIIAAAVTISLGLLLALLTLAQSGSRSGILALGIAVCILGGRIVWAEWKSGNTVRRRRAVWTSASVGAFAVLGMLLILVGPGSRSSLGQRLRGSIVDVRERGVMGLVKKDRWELWSRALLVTREHPVTGIGLGAYWTEIPNFLKIDARLGMYRDNAANWFLQVTAELGIVGLLIALWPLAIVVRASLGAIARGVDADRGPPPPEFFAAGGIIGLIALFPTGPHTNAAEVQLLFWFLAGGVCAALHARIASRTSWIAGAALVVILGVGQIRSGTSTLSIASQQAHAGFELAGGFHYWEGNSEGQPFRWMGREAWILYGDGGYSVAQSFMVAHPDAAERPVHLEVIVNGDVAGTFDFTSPGQWTELTFEVPVPKAGAFNEVRYRVDRVYIPAVSTPGSTDERELGALCAVPRVIR